VISGMDVLDLDTTWDGRLGCFILDVERWEWVMEVAGRSKHEVTLYPIYIK
jgi:hypothetical protein